MSDTEEDGGQSSAAGSVPRPDKDEGDKKDEGKEGEVLGKRVRVKKWNAVAFWSYGQHCSDTTSRWTSLPHHPTSPPHPHLSLLSPLSPLLWRAGHRERHLRHVSPPPLLHPHLMELRSLMSSALTCLSSVLCLSLLLCQLSQSADGSLHHV